MHMSEKMYIGIDLGGTSIKLAFISSLGKIIYQTSAPTEIRQDDPDHILHQMNDMINQGLVQHRLNKANCLGLGIGAPAFLDMQTGHVKEAINLGWKNYPLKEKLSTITQLPVEVDNDANTAALGEMWKGAGQGEQELLCVTLGTGVGGGIIINGDIHHGAQGTAGEIGHITVVPEGGFQCNCGKTGCLETVASATGMVKIARQLLKESKHQSYLKNILNEKGELSTIDIAKAAREGDPLAQEVINRVGFYLGLALGNYTVTMNPGKIVIGGGVSKAGDILFDSIRHAYKRFALPHLTGEIEIVAAQLGNDAGFYGAAWLIHRNHIKN